MKDNKSPIKKLLQSKLVIVFEVTVLVALSVALGKEVIRKYQVEAEIEELQQEISSLEERNVELDQLITYLDSRDYEEEQARLQLGLQRPGESVVAVLGASVERDENSVSGSVLEYQPEQDATSNPQRWWDFFMKKNNIIES